MGKFSTWSIIKNMDKKTNPDFSDKSLKIIYENYEEQQSDEEVLEGEVIDDNPAKEEKTKDLLSEEEDLRKRVESGEWDHLDNSPAFKKRSVEGQIMARTEAIDYRIRQIETRLPLLLNRNLTAAYVQMLKKIKALRQTKTAILALFYKDQGQRDLDHG